MDELAKHLSTLNIDEVHAKAEAGDVQSQYYLGMMYGKGIGTDVSTAKAFPWLLKAAQGGIAFAMNNIGYLYQYGLGCEKDLKTAFWWYLKAADTGLPPAYLNLFYCYLNGVGVEKNQDIAIKYLEKAANADNFPEAKLDLGDYYWGYEKNAEKWLYWYNKAINEDHSGKALFAMACHYLQGEGVRKDIGKAQALLEKSADAGYGEAAMILAQQYEQRSNYEKARHYYTIAAHAGNQNALAILIDQYQ